MNKKLFTIGSAIAISIPALAISCGSSSPKAIPKVTAPKQEPQQEITTDHKQNQIYDHLFDDVLRIKSIKDSNIAWSLIISETNTVHSPNEYINLLQNHSIRNTWLNKFKASYSIFAHDVFNTDSQSDFVYTEHMLDNIINGGTQTNPLVQYNSLGFNALHITNIAVIENSNTASTLKQRILVKFVNGIMNGFLEFEMQGTLENPTFRLTGPAGIGSYVASSTIKFVPRSVKSKLQKVPDSASVVTNGWLTNRASEPLWEHGKIMEHINSL